MPSEKKAKAGRVLIGQILGIAVIISLRMMIGSGSASEGTGQNYQELIRNLKWVLVTVENLDPALEKPQKLAEQIRDDVQTRLSQFSIQARMAEKAAQIPAKTYLWVRVRKIYLERTVYLNSLELVVKGEGGRENDTAPADSPPKYTRVSNQLYTVRQKIGYLLNDLIRDHLR